MGMTLSNRLVVTECIDSLQKAKLLLYRGTRNGMTRAPFSDLDETDSTHTKQ